MSLNWDATATPLSRTAKAENKRIHELPEWPVVETLIMVSPVLGYGSISGKNVEDIICRVRYYEALFGGIITSKGKPLPIPESIIRSLVGLTLNVTHEKTVAVMRRLAGVWRRDRMRELAKEGR